MGRHSAAPEITVEPRSSFGEEYWVVLLNGERRLATFDRDSRDPDHPGKAEADEFARQTRESTTALWEQLRSTS